MKVSSQSVSYFLLDPCRTVGRFDRAYAQEALEQTRVTFGLSLELGSGPVAHPPQGEFQDFEAPGSQRAG
jgi:hypothetical protein